MTENNTLSDWITTTEAAELTGYASAYMRQLILRGRLPGKKIGRDWLLLRKDVLTHKQKMDKLGKDKFNPNREKEKGA